jgi:pimeloyl-ACP methyl ester carboxylesterase
MPWEFFVRTIEVLGTTPEFIDANPQEFERRIGERADCRGCREAVARQLQCLADDDAETNVSRILAPTLVLAGEHDVLIPSNYARQMAGEIPDARFELIQQTGHNPLSERPREVIDRIARFLKSQEPASSRAREEESGTIGAWTVSEMV